MWFAENMQKGFGLALSGPAQIADQSVFALLDALFRQVLAFDAGEIAALFGREQHRVFQHARSFVVAALSPTGATLPTFSNLPFSRKPSPPAFNFHYLNGRLEFCFKVTFAAAWPGFGLLIFIVAALQE